MRLWWGKSSGKGSKKKTAKESFIDTFHKKFKSPESKSSGKSGGSRRRSSDGATEKETETRTPSPSKNVVRCLSFADRSQPLPLPSQLPANVSCTDSKTSESTKANPAKVSKSSSFLPLPRPSCIRQKLEHADLDGEFAVALICSECSMEIDDPTDSHLRCPLANDYDNGCRTAAGSPTSSPVVDRHPVAPVIAREPPVRANLPLNKNVSSSPPRRRNLNDQVPILKVPHHGAFYSAPDSSLSSPSRSPMRASGYEQVANTAFTAGRIYSDFPVLGSGQCSSPGSGQTSGHNSMVGDIAAQLLWQPSRGSPEYSPIPSPRMTSPGPSSRIHSGAVTPLHPRAGGGLSESQSNWHDDAKQQSHRLPLPLIAVPSPPSFSHQNSAVTSPSVPRSPGRPENVVSPGPRWKKGRLLGRGTFGHVYVGFNSETGEMCAMKEVTLFADDAKSKESAKQLGQEIALLSCLRHPNIVQYYGSEMVDDKLYIYLEYVSGGSIHKILQDYGKLGESAIRSYTQQILSGLAYLHAKHTVHRDIKGANILVDPNGRVKLADFGMAKHITAQNCPLSFKGSPYWMAPEVIWNSNGYSLAVDIWSLGCTVLEMATASPPWSQYEGVAAVFKIGNSKEMPTIPDYLSEEGKEFVRLCLQRNPLHRPTAVQLLEHAFVKNAAPLEKNILSPASSDYPVLVNPVNPRGIGNMRSLQQPDMERLAIHSSRMSQSNFHPSDIYIPRNISCPVSPIGSPLLHPRSPQNVSGRMTPSPISSPRTTSGSSTPLTNGIGAPTSFHLQSMSLHDGFGNLQIRPPNPPYWDPDLLRGSHSPVGDPMPDVLEYDGDRMVKTRNGVPGTSLPRRLPYAALPKLRRPTNQ
ncbi:mitogen-activated protein kinase kinase kinase YODA-like [Andrographis paniculata]|uniref:mitogen-activated protein kinase kinase kinase YODA-like n=1 Tax=Andrographis paniculata TaxID=175694 RepID=UPI0021E91424|nr:mitogen-activated protein kinase kinase kinase YODA-like [Andrographis paniculata]XP_051122745.1 mitogen-activated protein kinase kinase kinase YODA-like [Andrographis paniculata]XP_051122746.1 mitogen-activated protein kinase kinase kinase YODA-like [Andrographis paniculata]XP_051122747.1 mitogen-activated protein kinase kinase kinase YODA-like [Andrographis paniculata]